METFSNADTWKGGIKMYLLTKKKLRFITDRNWFPIFLIKEVDMKTKWILYLVGLVFIVFFILFLLGLAMSQELPSDFGFLKKLPVVSYDECQEKATGKNFFCITLTDGKTFYLVVLDEKGNCHEILNEEKSLWKEQEVRL
jgi:hypothetical protein